MGELIMRIFFRITFAGALAAAALGNAFGASTVPYVTTVHLHDGKQVVCAVNEPLPMQAADRSQTLTTGELNEAQIDATARLRRHPGNKNHYPSASTAPHVACS
ncbi:hypothetical protein PQQ52_19540 [Paraburkholderia sediminicola]|uniref:hypothetical protein n=1 Tax=Paraburkholderia sediminicola TaxID=458836 RepID=UPI0038BA6F0D